MSPARPGATYFWSSSIDELKTKDVTASKSDVNLADEITRAKIHRLKQANRLRGRFFLVACLLATSTVATSIALVIGALRGAEIEATVAIAFMSGLAVQTIGVLAVLAGYLFPKDRGADDG